jgi:ATP/maltotriose-dependent transcriptional regulator MalT
VQGGSSYFRIIPTKLNRLVIDSRWIVRPRLLSALGGAFGRKLTLISAPAGYSNTKVAAQWLDNLPHPSV